MDKYSRSKQLPLAALLARRDDGEEGQPGLLEDDWDYTGSNINERTAPWVHYLGVNLIELVRFLKFITTLAFFLI